MSMKKGMQRLGLLLGLIGGLWIFIMWNAFSGSSFWEGFLSAGVFPVAVVMGIYWVIYGFVVD